jgi:peptidyl-prolyl cis-trans isomerase SurA
VYFEKWVKELRTHFKVRVIQNALRKQELSEMKVTDCIWGATSAILLVLICFSSSPAVEPLNRVVAKVNNDIITLHELDTRIKQLTGLEPEEFKTRNKESFLETRKKILDLLIDEKIAGQKIQELGINVSREEVDAAIEKIKTDNNLTHEDLLAKLKEQGVEYGTYWEEIKKRLERTRLINLEVKSKIIVSEEEIKTYYQENQDQYKTEERVRLAAIILNAKNPSDKDEVAGLNRKVQEILSRLKNGEDFGELAKIFSQGPGAEDGGDLGFFETSRLDPELQKVIQGMSPGEVSKPIIRPSGAHIIKLLERYPEQKKPLETVRDAIYDILYRQEVEKRYTAWIKGLREKAYTRVIF